MNTNIQSIGFTPQADLLELINGKTEQLFRHFPRALSCEIIMKIDNSGPADDKSCSIRLVIPGNDLLAEVKGHSFPESVALAMEAIEHQIQKKKTKLKSERRRSSIDNG